MAGGVAYDERERPVVGEVEIVVVATDLRSRFHVRGDFEEGVVGHGLR